MNADEESRREKFAREFGPGSHWLRKQRTKCKRRVTPTISVRQQPSVEAVYGATIRRRISSRLALT